MQLTLRKSLAAFVGQEHLRWREGHLMPDHVHMLLMIPPKHAVSQVMGFINGKRAIHIARVHAERRICRPAFFGRGGVTGCPRLARTRLPCVKLSGTRKKKDQRLEQLELRALWAVHSISSVWLCRRLLTVFIAHCSVSCYVNEAEMQLEVGQVSSANTD